jgi:hypothetical protein
MRLRKRMNKLAAKENTIDFETFLNNPSYQNLYTLFKKMWNQDTHDLLRNHMIPEIMIYSIQNILTTANNKNVNTQQIKNKLIPLYNQLKKYL